MDPRIIISELAAAGMSQGEIAEAIGMDQSGVSRLQSGQRKRLSYEFGERLVELHRVYMRKVRRNGAKAAA